MFVVVQDFGTKVQNVRLTIEHEASARSFAESMSRQFPGSTFTLHQASDVIDYSTPHQIGEEFPLRAVT